MDGGPAISTILPNEELEGSEVRGRAAAPVRSHYYMT